MYVCFLFFNNLFFSTYLSDTPFKQQRLKAWQPILTPNKVIGIFLCIGIIFVPVGVQLLYESASVS